MSRRLAVVLLAALVPPALAVPPQSAQQLAAKTAKGEKSPWTVDDVVLSETATDFRVAPDGRHVVWVKSTFDKEKGERVPHLVRSRLGEKEEVELTRGEHGCESPRWSPDGKLIAFVSARPAPKKSDGEAKPAAKDDEPKPQLWLINPFGGEPWPLTELGRAVTTHAWAGPSAVVFAAQEEATLRENTLKDEKKDTAVVVEDEKHEPPVRLFRVEVKSKKVTRLTDNADRIQGLEASPDGRRAVTIHERSLSYIFDNKVKPAVFLHDLATGEGKQVFADRKFNISLVAWARDGKGIYAVHNHTTHPRYVHAFIDELYYYDVESAETIRVNLDWEHGLGAGMLPAPGGFLALLANGARHKAARYTRDGQTWKREWLGGEKAENLFGWSLGTDGKTLVYLHSAANTPEQWYHAALDGAKLGVPRQVTQLNEHLKKKTKARTEVVRWKGAMDEDVEGILYYPHDYEEGKKYPLVVAIHGGPMGADFDAWDESWAYAPNLLCQRGAFVLKPNYHGSSNYGLKWAESLADGKYYELPLADVEKGVDALVARGLADPEKLGSMGWSNGAILTVALIAQNPRYKAASAGAGGAEWVGDWGACEFGMSFNNYYFGKSPLEDPQLYIKMAPLYQFDKVRTPTLLFQGTEDRVVPPHHGWAQFRTLQQLGKTDVRFLLFPGEKHSLQKLAHQRRKLSEELAWFDKHLFKTTKTEPESLKPGSPLANALKLKGTKREGSRYGVTVNGVLAPETVKYEGLEVGRFEVTRAQYAQFDKQYAVEPGKESYPAHGIGFEQAKAYCAWLSKETGQTYRLPNEEEAEELYGAAEGTENTLDYWAGYAVNPEDAARLREQVRELGGAASLLKEVGSFKGAGKDERVFDLGGNVAEWVAGKDGKGRAAGGSADRPADARRDARRDAPECVGFRVVKAKGP